MRVVVTSPRVAPGLLTLDAWDALRGAERVLCPDPGDPGAQAVRDAGIEVRIATDVTAQGPGVVWLAPVGDPSWVGRLAARLEQGDTVPEELEVVRGSHDLPGARVVDLVAVMDRLRRECPWTREQTHESLGRYLLEESYEVLDALDREDHDHLREELGDVLMQVVFHAVVAQGRDDGWTIDDVAEHIVDKLVERNPHVFGDVEVSTAAEVDANWQAIKAATKNRASPLEGIPATLPALAYADKVLDRTERLDADRDERPAGPGQSAEAGDRTDIGRRLLALVREARAEGVDAEAELRRAVRRLVDTDAF